MLLLSSASAEKCYLLNPNACGLYDCGGNSWSPDETQGNGDNLSLRSGQVNMIGSSRVCMKVTGPGLVKFVWKVDPMAQHVGTLGFWVDNAQVAVCKSREWAPISYTLRERRDYDLAWQFHKFKSIPAGMGAGWIKNIEVINAVYNESKRVEDLGPSNRIDSLPEFSDNSVKRICPENSVSSSPNITTNIKLSPNINDSINISLKNNESDSDAEDAIITSNETKYLGKLKEVHVYANESKCSDCCQRIRDAIGCVETGGVVRIHNGTYNCTDGPININKSLHLIGENRSNTTIVIQSYKGLFIEHDNNTTIENISLVCNNPSQSATIGVHAVSGNDLIIKYCNIKDFTIGILINDTKKISIQNNYITSARESNYYTQTQDLGFHRSIVAIIIDRYKWTDYCIKNNTIENNSISLVTSNSTRGYGIWIGGEYIPCNLTTIWQDSKTHNSISVNCCKIYRKSGEACECSGGYLCGEY